MSKFIEVNDVIRNGQKLEKTGKRLINSSQIESVSGAFGATRIICAVYDQSQEEQSYYDVSESYEEVKAMLVGS